MRLMLLAVLWLGGCVHVSAPSVLETIIADIDEERDLVSAQQQLQELRRTEPDNPEILIQLARVEIMLAYDGRSSPMGLPRRYDPDVIQRAEGFLEDAAGIDPGYANTWVLYGHLAYLDNDFERSIRMLEHARSLGTANPWLEINRGDALWAMSRRAVSRTDSEHLAKQAEQAYLAGLSMNPDARARTRANRRLSEIYAQLGDIGKLKQFSRAYINSSAGLDRAHALHHEAILLDLAGDVDGAVTSARAAMEVAEFPLGRNFLGYVLAVKAGTLYRLGKDAEAGLLVSEAKAIAPDLQGLLRSEPYVLTAIPIIYALHGSGELRDFSVPSGGRILVGSSMFGSRADISALLDWGADPNYVHPDYGTALHASILSDNVDVVQLLLERGADPLAKDANGATPYEIASGSQSESRKKIRQLLSEKAGMAAIRRAISPGEFLVMSGHYRTRTAMGEARWGDVFDAGEHLTYVGRCTFSDQDFACFRFMERDGAMSVRDLALPKDDVGRLPDLLEEFFD